MKCNLPYITATVVAFTVRRCVGRSHNFGDNEGNIHALAAVADIEGDGQLEVILPTDCYGKLHVYNGETGAEEWTLQLGPRT